ncbi:DUF5050 domain-containing protein [Vallitalea sp.]|jgi:hypothetical protein|uniref:DUF5050 domain-containing protein n=1 Tax=Vallitalea sp. TaxID=1882829 RepID=UPI0025FD0E0E|nr:DUF5050 domain-containing protein [Vallitalea sp.]MCT4688506.1 DUF5050 domain-containing protein [Vallitalea sp.]
MKFKKFILLVIVVCLLLITSCVQTQEDNSIDNKITSINSDITAKPNNINNEDNNVSHNDFSITDTFQNYDDSLGIEDSNQNSSNNLSKEKSVQKISGDIQIQKEKQSKKDISQNNKITKEYNVSEYIESSKNIAFTDNKFFYIGEDSLLKSYDKITKVIITISDIPVYEFMFIKEKLYFLGKDKKIYECNINGDNIKNILPEDIKINTQEFTDLYYCSNNIIFENNQYLYQFDVNTRKIEKLSSTPVRISHAISHSEGVFCYKNYVVYIDKEKNLYRKDMLESNIDFIANNVTAIYCQNDYLYYTTKNTGGTSDIYMIPVNGTTEDSQIILTDIKITDLAIYKNWLVYIYYEFDATKDMIDTNNKIFLYNLDTKKSIIISTIVDNFIVVHDNELYYYGTKYTPDPIYYKYNFSTNNITQIGSIKNIPNYFNQ